MDYYLAAPHSYLVARIYVVSYLNFDGILKDFLTVSEGPYSIALLNSPLELAQKRNKYGLLEAREIKNSRSEKIFKTFTLLPCCGSISVKKITIPVKPVSPATCVHAINRLACTPIRLSCYLRACNE